MSAEKPSPADEYFRRLFGRRDSRPPGNRVLDRLLEKQANEKEGFIYVPSIALYLAKEITLQGESWNDCHEELAKKNAFMPTIPQFREFLKYLKANPRGTNDASRAEIEEILDEILALRIRGGGEWLDGRFEEEGNKLKIYYHVLENGKLIERAETLSDYLNEDRCPGIDLADWLETANSHGLPAEKTKEGKLFYRAPLHGRTVAGFGAAFGSASLNCSCRNPDHQDERLGVREAVPGGGPRKS